MTNTTLNPQQYKQSGTPWLGSIPKHWTIHRLGNIADMRVSNVDKHTRHDELPVRLCNYIDVYKNEEIHPSMNFMRATASVEEIKKFRLQTGDVLITKDSESWNDIGVPALVTNYAEDLISGYHLALFRPTSRILGPFLAWALRSKRVSYHFHVAAQGVTRFGLTHTSIKAVPIATPPLDEQAAIVRYLDEADQQIQAYISAKEKLIALLVEQRQAIIQQAVTRGLDPNVKLKPSGVEWLGDVPEHWEFSRIKNQLYSLNHKRIPLSANERGAMSMRRYDYYGASGVIDKVDHYLFDDELLLLAEDGANLVLRNLPLAIIARGKFWVNNHAHILKPKDGNLDFLAWKLEGIDYTPWISGAAQPKLTQDRLMSIPTAVPTKEEQDKIVERVLSRTRSLQTTIDQTRRQIELMEEYRTRLIADVVTGKVDVRATAKEPATNTRFQTNKQ